MLANLSCTIISNIYYLYSVYKKPLSPDAHVGPLLLLPGWGEEKEGGQIEERIVIFIAVTFETEEANRRVSVYVVIVS